MNELADLMETGAHRHGRRDAGLQARARAKIAEVDRKIADLTVIRQALLEAVDAGCDDLVACAESSCCPLRFTELTINRRVSDLAGHSSREHHGHRPASRPLRSRLGLTGNVARTR